VRPRERPANEGMSRRLVYEVEPERVIIHGVIHGRSPKNPTKPFNEYW